MLINEGENSFVDARTSWVPGSYEGSGRDIEIADMDCDGHPDLILGTHGVEWSDGTPWGGQT